MGTRRQFSREFKLEAVKLVRKRGVSVAQDEISTFTRMCCASGFAKQLLIRRKRFLARE